MWGGPVLHRAPFIVVSDKLVSDGTIQRCPKLGWIVPSLSNTRQNNGRACDPWYLGPSWRARPSPVAPDLCGCPLTPVTPLWCLWMGAERSYQQWGGCARPAPLTCRPWCGAGEGATHIYVAPSSPPVPLGPGSSRLLRVGRPSFVTRSSCRGV